MASEPRLDVRRIGETCYVTTTDMVLEFANLREHSEGLTAEVTATIASTGKQHWARVNLSSTQARATFAKALLPLGLNGHGGPTLDEACHKVARILREADPAVPLVARREDPNKPRWFIDGLIPLGQTSVIYGDGGSGKSTFALALALAGLSRRPLAGSPLWAVAPVKKVLYLDWESEQEDLEERLFALAAFHGEGEAPTDIVYRSMSRGLTDLLPIVRKDAHDADLVIVDSLGPACGAEPEGADAAIRVFNALRTLDPATRLVIAHVSKTSADATGPARPFGSVFVSNLARSIVEVKRDDGDREDGAMTVTYTHRKCNRGPRLKPRALCWAYGDGLVSVSTDQPDFSRLGLTTRILDVLRHGPKTAQELAQETGAPENQVRARLSQMNNRTVIAIEDNSIGGRGKKSRWGLIDRKRTGPEP